MTIIKHKRGTGIPSPSDLRVGEIAIDISTGTAYTKASDGRVVSVGGNSSGGDGGSGGPAAWDQITGKPSTFPPESHTHEQSEVDGLELRLEAIEGSITDGGGFVDAPDDGKLYGRQSEAWAEVVIPSTAWDDITSKPTEFPPSAHTHEIEDVNGLQDALDNAGGDSATYTLPVVLRSGAVQLPLTLDGAKLAVMTRGGELELPLAA
jgi:hypothetical protein